MVRRISVELLIIASIGLILGLLGPFGTYPMPTALRLSYWIGYVIAGYAIFRPATVAAWWLHEHSRFPYFLTVGMAVGVASLPLALMIGFAVNGMRIDGPMLTSGFTLLYAQCAGIGFAIFILMRLIFPRDIAGETTFSGNPAEECQLGSVASLGPSPKIFDRLPTGFPEPIYALSVEDHYVRVHAKDRSEMLLLRLSDAISEMDGADGTQVHRSWWIAADAVISAKRQNRNWRLILKNALEAPVSRSHVTKLKQMGWLN